MDFKTDIDVNGTVETDTVTVNGQEVVTAKWVLEKLALLESRISALEGQI